MDAMSDAVDGAAAVCFGVSAAYKESSNCRLEAQYAHQTGVDMIPMMMESPEKKVRGWLGKLPKTPFWAATRTRVPHKTPTRHDSLSRACCGQA